MTCSNQYNNIEILQAAYAVVLSPQFSSNPPSGPIRSSICDVHIYIAPTKKGEGATQKLLSVYFSMPAEKISMLLSASVERFGVSCKRMRDFCTVFSIFFFNQY